MTTKRNTKAAPASPVPASPTPTGVAVTPQMIDFGDALVAVTEGKYVTKQEWNDPNIYLLLVDTKLKIHLADRRVVDLIVTDGDILGKDWYVLP